MKKYLSFALATLSIVAVAFLGSANAALGASNPTTDAATGISQTDATLNATNGDDDAIGHSFWASLSTFSTASPTLPPGVYSTADLGPIASSTAFSALLSSVSGLGPITASTTYYFAGWSDVGGTWYPGSVESFATLPVPPGPVFIDSNTNGTFDSGEQDFATIQAAVDAAVAGNTIKVTAGTYTEHVVVNKSLTINGAGSGVDARTRSGSESIVDGSDTDAPFAIRANDVTIDGFTVENGSNGSYFSGIWTETGHTNITIQNNIITQNGFGVWAECGGNCLIKNNLFNGNNKSNSPGSGALSADSTTGLTISDNEFKNDSVGNPILLQAVSADMHNNIVVSGNSFDTNTNASVIYALGITNGTFEDNTINAASDVTGISFSGADKNITFTGNTINGAARAVRIEDAGYYGSSGSNSNITLHNNSFLTNSEYGVGNVSGYTGAVDATSNWWGDATGPLDGTAGDGSTPDTNAGTGSKASGAVNYSPWFTNLAMTTLNTDPIIVVTPPVVNQNDQGITSGSRPSHTSVQTTTNTNTGAGQVLGAATFQFLTNLHYGMTSGDVVELQARLRAEGFFTYPTNTGYFGPFTFAAAKAYQRAHPEIGFITGFVGPLTRAVLNK